MDKLALALFKWIILPAAIGAFGYFVIGPRIGRSESEPAATAKVSQESTETADASVSAEPVPAEPEPAKPTTKPTKTVAPREEPSAPSKFDPAVPQGDQAPSGNGVDVAPVPTERVSVKPASPDEPKPKVVRKPKPKKDPAEGGVEGAPVVKKSSGGDFGPGDDVKKSPVKPKAKPEKNPDLPKTPPEPKEPGGGEEGTGG
jgi:cytoskeletal protein RodZ